MAHAKAARYYRNVGSRERWVRLGIAGATIPAMIKIHSTPLRILLGAVAVAGITTAVSRFCPVTDLVRGGG
jgi:hypothetical protein